MELKNNKSAWAALATLGVGAVVAGATAFAKIREHRRQRKAEENAELSKGRLTAEQMMVYNEAITAFMALNDRIYALRNQSKQLQPLVKWLATGGERPQPAGDADSDVLRLTEDIGRFLTTQKPFINACLATIDTDGMTYEDCVRGSVGGTFDPVLDETPKGTEAQAGAPIVCVLRLGYYFPDSTIAPHPVKSIVLV